MKRRRSCELCDGEAAVYCAADSAFLCLPCDGRVHGANFLAARHVRRAISAARSPPIRSSCGQDSSTAAAAAAVERWSRQLGLRRRRRCVRAAARVLGTAGHVLPARVGTAAALWAGIRAVEGIGACEGALRRLAAEAHVPAKLIVAGEWRLRRIAGKSPAAAEEGWGECC